MRNRIFITLTIILLTITSCEKDTIRGGGEIKTESRELDGFDKVILEIPSEVTLKKETNLV